MQVVPPKEGRVKTTKQMKRSDAGDQEVAAFEECTVDWKTAAGMTVTSEWHPGVSTTPPSEKTRNTKHKQKTLSHRP